MLGVDRGGRRDKDQGLVPHGPGGGEGWLEHPDDSD